MMYTYGYLYYLPLNILYGLIIVYSGIKNKRPYQYYLYVAIFAVYLNNAIDIVFFPIIVADIEEWGGAGNYVGLILNPITMSSLQFFGNILLTIPLGFILPFVVNCNNKARCIFAVIISCSFEIIQLFLIIFCHSVLNIFDINDIVLNVSGGIVGILLFKYISVILYKFIISKKNNALRYTDAVISNVVQNKKSLAGIKGHLRA